MPDSPLIDWRHQQFLLHEVFEVGRLTRYPYFAEHSVATFDAALELAHQLALTHFLPHNRAADVQEPAFAGRQGAAGRRRGDGSRCLSRCRVFRRCSVLRARRHATALHHRAGL